MMSHPCKVLFENNINLARKIAHEWHQKSHIPLADAMGIAQAGLFRASQHYDPHRGAFSTLAVTVIRNAIRNYIRRTAEEQQREQPLLDNDPADSANTEKAVMQRFTAARVRQAISELPERYAAAVTLYYGVGCDPHTYKEVGEYIGVTKQRAFQMVRQGREKLRHKLNGVV